MGQRLLFVSAGDPSGDNATSRLLANLTARVDGLETFGLGGPKMKALGQEQLVDGAQLAVLGFWEVARRFLFFRKLLSTCVEEIKKRQPSCVLLVDYPGFNLRLAERIKPLGIPIVYYISPQVWAWAKKRVHQIKRLVDLIMLILPFEKAFFDEYEVPNQMVGHYLLDDIPDDYIGSPLPDTNQAAILPGSRPQEIERMLAPMLETARRLNRTHGTTAVVAGLKNAYAYERMLRPEDDGIVSVSYGDSRRIIKDSRLVLTASGTATLETGIIGRPMVIVYKTGFVTYQIARRLVKLDSIGLVNLVLGEKVVPELIQQEVNPQRMEAELSRYIGDDGYRTTVVNRLREVPGVLGGPGASQRAAELVSEFL